jgi:hypothetical protein
MATLDDVARLALRDAVTGGWLACAPPALAGKHVR